MIERVRTFIGYREYPKYGIVCRYAAYKRALLAEADRLVRAGVLAEREDAFHLTFQEFHAAARARTGGRRPRTAAQGGVPCAPGAHSAAGPHLGG